MIHFVGAGPGAIDLITVRGMEYLKNADIIIYAGSLVNPGLLEYAKKECEVFDSAYMNLDEVITVMKRAWANGKELVRLHTGEPSIYGTIREQMDILDNLDISYDVCPGVSSMFGAAAALKCELTLPEVSQSVIITRAAGRTDVPDKEALRSLAGHNATMTLFLSAGLARDVRDELIAGGYREDTPVGVVYKATWPDEKVIRTSLGRLPEEMEREGINKTAMIIVGDVLGDKYAKSKLYDAGFTTEYRKGTGKVADNIDLKRIQAKNRSEYDFKGKKILMVACSKNAYNLMQQLKNSLLSLDDAPACVIDKVKCKFCEGESIKTSVKDCVSEYYDKVDAIIFISATGIAIRSIAPFIGHKSEDPAVLVLDEQGEFCVPLIGGHMGGANALSGFVSDLIGAKTVITTATDIEGKFAVDDFARTNNLVLKDWKLAKEISVEILTGKEVGIYSDMELEGKAPDELCIGGQNKYNIVISNKANKALPDNYLQLIPKNIVVGIGCRRDTPYDKIKAAITDCLAENGVCEEAVCAVASIDIKSGESGIIRYCEERKLPFVTYGSNELNALEGEFTESEFVEKTTGVSNVCERSALLGATERNNSRGTLICKKTVYDGVTVALALRKGSVHF